VFVAPTSRIAQAAWPPAPLGMVLPALGLVLLLLVFRTGRGSIQALAASVVAVVTLGIFIAGGSEAVYWLGWFAVSQSAPLGVMLGAGLLASPAISSRLGPAEWSRRYACLAAAALCSLVQFPFAAPIYFCYVAPLVVLGATAVWGAGGNRPKGALLSLGVAVLLTVFAVGWLNGRGEGAMWSGLRPRMPLVPLGIARAGLRVPEPDALLYQAVVDELGRHSGGGYTYAGPDAPEVYFLAGLRNPTRALFDFIEPASSVPELRTLRRLGVTAIAINRQPKFSAPLSDELQHALEAEFPDERSIGKFTVRWKE
jgi:hypothetical protein